MAGQVIKRGDRTWTVRVFQGRDANGKRRYMNKTIKGTKKDAESYRNSTLTQISTGNFVEPVKLTVDEYLEKWIAIAAKPRLRERTLDDYKEKLKRYVEPVIGAQKLSDVRSLDVQSIYTGMAERNLSPRTIRYTHAILASAFKQAVKWNMLLRNPCDAVELPDWREPKCWHSRRRRRLAFLMLHRRMDKGIFLCLPWLRVCERKNTSD